MRPAEHIDPHPAPHRAGFGIPVRVYFQDTDAGGVVYHSRYLDFLERARYEWLRSLGFGSRELAERHVVFVIRSLHIDYLKPARLDDLLEATVRVLEAGRSRILLEQHMVRDRALLARARVEAACIDGRSFKPMSIPPEIRRSFEQRCA